VSSIFHASYKACLTLAYYYVTLGLTLNVSDIIKRDKIASDQKLKFLTVPAILTQCFSLSLQHHQTNNACLLPHFSYHLTTPVNIMQIRINSN
jgi:hypothetical protein